MYVAPSADMVGHVLEGKDAELDVEDEDETEDEEDEDEDDVELEVGRRVLDVLLEIIEVDAEKSLLEEVVRMRLLDVLLVSEMIDECGVSAVLGMGSKESLECRWIQFMVPL